jgi:hypothetical protein
MVVSRLSKEERGSLFMDIRRTPLRVSSVPQGTRPSDVLMLLTNNGCGGRVLNPRRDTMNANPAKADPQMIRELTAAELDQVSGGSVIGAVAGVVLSTTTSTSTPPSGGVSGGTAPQSGNGKLAAYLELTLTDTVVSSY